MEGVSYEQAWEWATNVFKDSVAPAAERDVVINFEPLAPSETNFVNTHTEAIQFVQQLESPNFKVILDVKAMCSMGKPIPEIIRESAGEFGYFHANDENLKGPGFGEVDFNPSASRSKKSITTVWYPWKSSNSTKGRKLLRRRACVIFRRRLHRHRLFGFWLRSRLR